VLILWIAAAVATPVGLAAPDRLTAGTGHQYLGAEAPGGRELYFATDQQSTTQIYVQDLASGVPQLAFDELADATWPRPSPDGRLLLYISYREDAAGDLCVRAIEGRPGARRYGPRRCLTGPDSAELQASWFPDSGSIALVTRAGLHGDFELVRIGLDGRRGERLVSGNATSPAVSPDGHWLVTVPVERSSRDIGPSFLSRTAGALALTPIAGSGAPATLAFDLPGTSAMPAFSLDGHWLYFTQFLNDTNFDGAIDGNDHGVLFRAGFRDGKLGPPEQLSSARSSCQYPVPSAERLIATCLVDHALDVFALPLAGAVPPAWTAAAVPAPAQRAVGGGAGAAGGDRSGDPASDPIADQLDASRDRWERLLLLAHRGSAPDVLRQVIRLHLELGEYESARFYALRLERSDPAAGSALRELAEQRRGERALGRGALSAPFVAASRARLARLAHSAHPLAAIVQSEILDVIGEDDAARRALDKLDVRDPLAAALYAERLLALYRDDPRYFELYRPLAEAELEHAEAFVRELVRGAGGAERAARIDRWLHQVDAYSDLAFLLELERALAALTPGSQEPVRAEVFALYRKNKQLERRRALVAATVRRALALDADELLYQFADSWVSYVPRERAERRYAERLYRDAVFERAYVEAARGATSDARGHFYGVTLQTESLEAHAEFIEMRIAEGKDPARDYPGTFSPVVNHYARAYLAARRLPELGGLGGEGDRAGRPGPAGRADPEAHARAVDTAIRELTAVVQIAPQRAEVHQLWGFVAHQRFLLTGDRLAAVEANAHDLVALALARDNPRARAAILDGLGRIQAAVGNYGLARGWLEARAKLPFASARSQLSHCLALARARFHTGDLLGAASDSDRCVAQTVSPGSSDLARYRAVALDRSGLYHLAAGQPEAAAARYAELWPLVSAGPTSPRAAGSAAAGAAREAARNQLTTRIGQASAAIALGRARDALDHIAAAEALVAASPPGPRDGAFGRERPTQLLPADSYQLLLLGLRAQAEAAAGDPAAATRSMTARRDAIARRFAAGQLDEDRLELAVCEAQLARFARAQRAPVATALGHLGAARQHFLAWSASTNTPLEDTGLAILAGFAELHLFAGVPQSQLGFDLAAELSASYTRLSELRNPAWEPSRARLAVYLTMLQLRSPAR
jgi:hypothetical protein